MQFFNSFTFLLLIAELQWKDVDHEVDHEIVDVYYKFSDALRWLEPPACLLHSLHCWLTIINY